MTNLSRYCTLNGTDLTDYIAFDDPPTPIQPKRLIKNEPIIGSRRNVLWSEGLDNFGYNVNLQFDPSQWADYDTVTALFQNLTDGDLFYPRSDRFMVCKYGSCVPVQSKSSGSGQGLRLKGTLYSEAAELYSATPSSWSPTDEILPIVQSSGETNAGNIAAGLYSLDLTARMAGPALEFDGSDDYVTAGAVDLSGDALTVEMGCAISDLPGSTEFDGLFDYQFTNATEGTMAVCLRGTNGGYLAVAFGTAASSQYHEFMLPTETTWYRIMLTVDVTGNAVKCYVNGIQSGATWTPSTALSSFAASKTVLVGKRNDRAECASASFSMLRCWTRVLSETEALASSNGESVSATDLEIEYDFCEGQGTTVYDLSGNGNDGTLTNFADTTAGYGDAHDSGWLTSIGPISPTLQLLTATDAVESQMTLAPGLMTSEVLSQDRFGQISQTYRDDFAANVGRPAFDNGHFWADGYCYAKYIDSEIVLTSLINGRVGEEISITITDTDQASTTVSVSGYDITVDLETDAGTPVATAQEVIDAINADEDAAALVEATLASGEDGDTVLDTQAKTQLALNVDVTGGALVIEDDREAGYHLVGSWPIVSGGLVVTFTPTITGTPTGSDVVALEASVDSGSTWETVIDSSSSDWADGEEMEVTIPDRIVSGATEVWIRWRVMTSITSVAIDDLEIYQERAVSDSNVPNIPVGSTYKIQLDGTGWGDLATVWRNRYIP